MIACHALYFVVCLTIYLTFLFVDHIFLCLFVLFSFHSLFLVAVAIAYFLLAGFVRFLYAPLNA